MAPARAIRGQGVAAFRRAGFVLLALSVVAGGIVPAAASEEIKPPDLSPPDTWVPKAQGSLRVMNKIDSTVQLVPVQVGQSVTYQTLVLSLSGCFVRPDDLPEDAAAHLKIVDHHPDAPGFDGWILKREPALNMLQNPVYDVQLAGCG